MSISASVGVSSTGNFTYGGNLVLNRLSREEMRVIESLVCRHTDVYRRHFNTTLFTEEGDEGKKKERQQPRQSSSQKSREHILFLSPDSVSLFLVDIKSSS